MRENLRDSLNHILQYEGGYVDHPRDPGGATNMGITIGTLANHRRQRVSKQDVRNLTLEEAEEIYLKNYWTPCKCDLWSPGIDFAVFDCAVNQGVGDARRFLQRAARVTADGIIGPITIQAVQTGNPLHILHEFQAQRMNDYGGLGGFKTFGLGWSRRLMATTMYALEMQKLSLQA